MGYRIGQAITFRRHALVIAVGEDHARVQFALANLTGYKYRNAIGSFLQFCKSIEAKFGLLFVLAVTFYTSLLEDWQDVLFKSRILCCGVSIINPWYLTTIYSQKCDQIIMIKKVSNV